MTNVCLLHSMHLKQILLTIIDITHHNNNISRLFLDILLQDDKI